MTLEETVQVVTRSVSHAAEVLAAVLIAIGVVQLICAYVLISVSRRSLLTREEIRVRFGSVVAVALELMLGADVLATAMAPGWDDIGKLAAIAVIRTALNYFLGKELSEVKKK